MVEERGNYSSLIDRQVWEFIEQTDACYPPGIVDYSIAQQRDIYNKMCQIFMAEYPEGVTSSDHIIENDGNAIGFRRYMKAGVISGPLVMYFHGGGYVVGGLDSHDDICAEICDATGFNVVCIDYRLAPEHLHPAAFDDALAAFAYFSGANDTPLLLVGDSAGANLAAAVCHATRYRSNSPIGQVLIYPELGGDTAKGSYLAHSQAPLLSTKDVDYYRQIRGNGDDLADDVTNAPLRDDNFSDLPPTVTCAAECDPLADDSRDYQDKILAAGGKVKCFKGDGLVHGYLRARHSSVRAAENFEIIVSAILALGHGKWLY